MNWPTSCHSAGVDLLLRAPTWCHAAGGTGQSALTMLPRAYPRELRLGTNALEEEHFSPGRPWNHDDASTVGTEFGQETLSICAHTPLGVPVVNVWEVGHGEGGRVAGACVGAPSRPGYPKVRRGVHPCGDCRSRRNPTDAVVVRERNLEQSREIQIHIKEGNPQHIANC